jgi:carbon-monoxide dehydrogenase small subunit
MTKELLRLRVNGEAHVVAAEPHHTLLEVLREELQLTGTKHGCELGECGACTVLVDGVATKSCTRLAVQADGSAVTTIEGLAIDNKLHPVQESFWAKHGLQCGFCTPGMIMASVALLRGNPNPTPEQVRQGLEGNLCRCTGYQNIVRAVSDAAKAGGGRA